jgi:SAM-dependent methyltransferase
VDTLLTWSPIMSDSLNHLQAHHGDFANFRDVMITTSVGRFGPIWWGVWDQHVQAEGAVTVVDLGCGPGMLLPQLRQRLPDARLIGVEVQPVMLETASEVAAGCGAEIIVADLAAPVPLPDGCADVVAAVMSFHELEFPPPLIEEAFRLLKPGGMFVLYDWVKRPLSAYLGDKALDEGLLQHFREHCLFSADDLTFLVERAGMGVREVVGRRGGNYAIIVAEKATE